MSWRAYQVIFRVRSPVHIGWVKIGNLQRTRPYVTGRVLWGALTMRLRRDEANGTPTANDFAQYQAMGEKVKRRLNFTYFYPALKESDSYRIAWPWDNPALFRSRFLSSYTSTPLNYPAQSAAEGMLHEAEFISSNCLDTGEPVYLQGIIFEREGCPPDWSATWQAALHRLQLGGERGYGWGRIERIEINELADGQLLFGDQAACVLSGDQVGIQLKNKQRLLAHAAAGAFHAEGEVEPLVGREWRPSQVRRNQIGQHVEFSGICFMPGSVALQECLVKIGDFGIWS